MPGVDQCLSQLVPVPQVSGGAVLRDLCAVVGKPLAHIELVEGIRPGGGLTAGVVGDLALGAELGQMRFGVGELPNARVLVSPPVGHAAS